MRMRAIAAAAAAAIVLAAAPGVGGAQSPTGQDLTPDQRGAYVAVAGAYDLYAVRAAELALDKAQRPEVREYAQAMLDDHRHSTEQLAEVARTAGLEELLPPAMMPLHWDMLRRLERARGARFDRIYVDQQVEAHETVVELHSNFAANGRGASLKAYAEAALPVASRHLDGARRLEE